MKSPYHLAVILLLVLSCGYSYASENQKILIVLTSHTELGNTGKKRVSGYLN